MLETAFGLPGPTRDADKGVGSSNPSAPDSRSAMTAEAAHVIAFDQIRAKNSNLDTFFGKEKLDKATAHLKDQMVRVMRGKQLLLPEKTELEKYLGKSFTTIRDVLLNNANDSIITNLSINIQNRAGRR